MFANLYSVLLSIQAMRGDRLSLFEVGGRIRVSQNISMQNQYRGPSSRHRHPYLRNPGTRRIDPGIDTRSWGISFLHPTHPLSNSTSCQSSHSILDHCLSGQGWNGLPCAAIEETAIVFFSTFLSVNSPSAPLLKEESRSLGHTLVFDI